MNKYLIAVPLAFAIAACSKSEAPKPAATPAPAAPAAVAPAPVAPAPAAPKASAAPSVVVSHELVDDPKQLGRKLTKVSIKAENFCSEKPKVQVLKPVEMSTVQGEKPQILIETAVHDTTCDPSQATRNNDKLGYTFHRESIMKQYFPNLNPNDVVITYRARRVPHAAAPQ